MKHNYKFLFLDVGGVLLTNGWDHSLRAKIAERFHFESDEFNSRHSYLFDLFERGKISLTEYLQRTIFYKKRPYSLEELKKAIFESAISFDEMIVYIQELKKRYQLKVVIVSNEGEELARDRVSRFQLDSFVDFFMFSSFVGMRKPEKGIYRMAMDLSMARLDEVIYLDDRKFLVESARALGITSILHEDLDATKVQIDTLLS